MTEKKKNNQQTSFWSGFFLGAFLGAGAAYFLGENDPQKRARLIKALGDFLGEDNFPLKEEKKASVSPKNSASRRVFMRQGRQLKK